MNNLAIWILVIVPNYNAAPHSIEFTSQTKCLEAQQLIVMRHADSRRRANLSGEAISTACVIK